MSLPDTHTHLDLIERETGATPADTLMTAREQGVDFVVDIGLGVAGSETVAARAESLGVYAAVGLHPNDLTEFPDGIKEIERLASSDPRVVAIGETGLDFYRDREDPDKQREAFAAHIELAKRLDKTLVIHCRDANAQVIDVLDAEGPPPRTILHCFSGDVVNANQAAERGIWCSFAGNLTYPRNEGLRNAARSIPTELLLVETDAPYLSPHPYRGKPNSPARIPVIAAGLAAARNADPDQLAAVLSANARRAFGLAEADRGADAAASGA